MRGWGKRLVRGEALNWPVQGERISASSEQGERALQEEGKSTANAGLCERTECFGETVEAPYD